MDSEEDDASFDDFGFIVRDFQQSGVNIVSSSNITIRNIEVFNCALAATGARQSANITYENCKIHHLDSTTGKEVAVLACQTTVKENLVVTRLSPEIRGIK